ncbi:phosphoribosylglycinamide formyltransferase [Falseniella ignava]|uniref:Phosphoribosylglycinamide formyltransferase n=1 Tax=Falseniella ignava CCUG 37419 TaxID=883112 RepID=K1ME83_9LACT|nr:phosphoribosylglycinamide formyltransferase [Falseniella ignava]EKB54334.1 phosphoribosylglycinamide formyltransferase [Falseniella ignava CCUG 37419]
MSSNFKRIAVFISGSGTNLQALIDHQDQFNGEIALVISSKCDAYGLERAKQANIPAYHVTDHASLLETLAKYDISLIVLAGYLKILPESLVQRYENQIINIHPSLIPSFSGKGYYGLKVHESAIARGVKISGATTHFVNEEADAGPIILQEAVLVEEMDTPETLQAKVLDVEHAILVQSVKLFTLNRLVVQNHRVLIRRSE